ncbi:hypothetical protein D0B54_02405 [Solimonas sp. K1W22B-7]|uniref:Mor transcription activator family protein n=1 Tax=Solimonas sp. K1W22B-7 TaxID=2303331 RepID=UPI000E32E0F4|nr:Mor transcription activator family protein [Solimonas sp. K1W22B-7]AXQ27593.1 hypothetical protein D0B54_02405 [Solimonas sp. K1W22B-7]
MSNADHLIIKRVVRSVLARSLALHQEAVDKTADEVIDALRFECGGDRLYVPRGKAHCERDLRIRSSYLALCQKHAPGFAMETLARREELSIRQLRRICAPQLLRQMPPDATRQ